MTTGKVVKACGLTVLGSSTYTDCSRAVGPAVVAAEACGYDGKRAKGSKERKNTVAVNCTRIISGHEIEARSELSTKNRGSIAYVKRSDQRS